jgi:hypothetical protein
VSDASTMYAERILECLCDPQNKLVDIEITPYVDLTALIEGAGEMMKLGPPVEIRRRLVAATKVAAKMLAEINGAKP